MKTIADFAAEFAEVAHAGQLRTDGLAYFTHPARVADLVRHYKGDSNDIEALCAAAYCHDLLEDTAVTYTDLVKAFGYLVASLVLELTTNPDMKKGIGDKAAYLGYKLKHMTSYALTIKLCDRLDNISDMNGTSAAWKKKYLAETEYILAYIMANRELTQTQLAIIEDISKILRIKR